MNAPVYDPAGARAGRDAGIDLVLANNAKWAATVYDLVLRLPTGWEGTGEDLRVQLLANDAPSPKHHNAWGGLANKCVRSGVLVAVNRHEPMKTRPSHSRKTPVYRKQETGMTTSAQPDTEHSSLVGGSTAARRIACPASYQMEAKLPASLKKQSSIYADEGTALHECMTYCLRNNLVPADLDEKVLGKTFAGFVMTRELIDEAIVPCLDFIDGIDLDDEGDLDILVENRVEIPGIPGAFGTADVIARTRKRSIGIDWKFGVGVAVRAEYDGEPNAQLMYYNRGGMHTFPHMYENRPDWPVDLYIVQPRVYDGDRISHVRVTAKQLEDFRWKLVRAIAEAKGDEPGMAKGDHCRFAPCKTICPKFTGPALDLSKLGKAALERKQGLLKGIDVDWGTMYGELLTLSEIAEELIAEIRAQAHVFMGDGNPVPGWKLVDKRATEKYVDGGAEKAAKAAVALGVGKDAVYTPREIKSPAQLRDTLAPLMQGKTKEDKKEAAAAVIGQHTKKLSSGTTIAPADDHRPNVIPTTGQLMKLADKLKALGAPKEEA